MYRLIGSVFWMLSALFLYVATSAGPGKETGEVLPLKDGNWWKYRITLEDSTNYCCFLNVKDGKKEDSGNWFSLFFITVNDEQDTKRYYPLDPEEPQLIGEVANQTGGLYIQNTQIITNKTFNIFKYPTFPGDTNAVAINKTGGYGGGNCIITLKVDEKVVCNNKTFNCIVYDIQVSQNFRIYVCPRVGIVKLTGYYRSGSKNKNNENNPDFLVELIDYKID